MAGRHAPPRRQAPNTGVAAAKTRPSHRRILTSIGSMAAALALAATFALPAVSASASFAPTDDSLQSTGTVHTPVQTQGMTVSADVTISPIVRDTSDIVRSYKPAGASIVATGGWVAPINKHINSPWGPRQVICTSGVGCDSGFHRGDDFAASCGTPFYSVAAGVVTAITHSGLAGDEIVVSHLGGVSTAYSHMYDSGILVSVGQAVSAGQNIGQVGSSGDSTGCHLYFEYRVGGLTVDPEVEMAAHGVTLGVV